MMSIVTPWAGDTAASLLPDYAHATPGVEVITVDNASAPATAAALRAAGGVYLRNDTNAGFARGNNQGYAKASGDIVIFLNSDIAADPSWLTLVAQDVRDGALYGPALQQQLVGGWWLPYLEGWCIAATRQTWRRLCRLQEPNSDVLTPIEDGPWDALSYPGPYWEDNDLCLRALQAGVSLIQTHWPIQHKGGRTAGALFRHAASFEANRATFAARVADAIPTLPRGPVFGVYMQHVQSESDIQHHLPLLYSYAKGTIVELGTRTGVSTAAFLAGVEQRGGHVWSVDLENCAHLYAGHPQWTFVQTESTDPALPGRVGPVDVLLIDTEHTYAQAAAELALWADHVVPGGVILMHDPETFPGVRRAAHEFATARGWLITFVLPCNGMAIIVRPMDGISTEGAAWALEAVEV